MSQLEHNLILCWLYSYLSYLKFPLFYFRNNVCRNPCRQAKVIYHKSSQGLGLKLTEPKIWAVKENSSCMLNYINACFVMEMFFVSFYLSFVVSFQFIQIYWLIFIFEDFLLVFSFLLVVLHYRYKEIFVTCSSIFIGIKCKIHVYKMQ